MITEILLGTSLVANAALGTLAYVLFARKMRYKKAFHRNVETCKKMLEYGRKSKTLTKDLDGIFNKLRANAKEQSMLVDQANGVIVEEENVASSMVEIAGDFKSGAVL